jgi:phospholipid/cholesterol/gamma-HCH transport system substrate-binding protein
MRTAGACAAPIAAAVRTSTLIAENTTERGKHMPEGLRGEFWRLAVFAIVCLLGTALIFVTFAQIRFENTTTYTAVFANVSGLQNGNFVRIGGVEVGKVKDISIQPDSTVRVKFSADDSVVLTEGNRAVIRYDDLIGGRFMALEEGAGGAKKLNPGATIPLAQTRPALDLDALIGGFRPLFRALNPDQINALSGQIIAAFQGQGTTIGSLLTQTADLTNTLADRDQLIGQVIVNLNTLLGSVGDQSGEFAKAVDSLSELVAGLQARKEDISNGVAYANAAAGSIADLLAQARPPLQKVVHETDRTAGLVVADHDFVDNLLNTLPDTYQVIGRLGLHGDFFDFYLCDLLLRLNGKGGQPVLVKVAGQSTGRCTPK